MANKIVYVQKLGRVPYKMAWDYQKVVAEKVRQNAKSKKEPGHTMLLLEHDPGKSLVEYMSFYNSHIFLFKVMNVLY